ncbi:MAG: MFS transporter [Flavobacteriales bacterium]|nr:MFS transporter [Flavobacteriales bacterium]
MSGNISKKQRFLPILLLILAGESIFILPFVLARVFRPTLLEVFEINNFQLGTFFSVYGIIATASYLFGGPLADRFRASRLIAFALAATAVGGIFMSTIPSPSEMKLLYAFWGVTTILLFWAALMKATREWGGQHSPGLAFGLLDGGRGAVSAIIGSVAVLIFAWFLPNEIQEITHQQRVAAFQNVILFVSIWVLCVSVLIGIALPSEEKTAASSSTVFALKGIREVATRPLVWLQAAIIVCAYSGYKVTDDFSLLAKDMLGYNEIDAAKVGTLTLWLRPLAAISAGILADRISSSKMILGSFALMFCGGVIIGFGLAVPSLPWLIFMAIVFTCLGVFALRGLYFALMGEAKIPWHVTGSAVGMASILGYTPDIYMGPLMGFLLDNSPGIPGHRHVFLLLVGFSLMGICTTLIFRRVAKEQKRLK